MLPLNPRTVGLDGRLEAATQPAMDTPSVMYCSDAYTLCLLPTLAKLLLDGIAVASRSVELRGCKTLVRDGLFVCTRS